MAEETFQKLFAELRSKSLREANNAERKLRAKYKELLSDLQGFLAKGYAELAKDGKLSVSVLQQKGKYARFLDECTKTLGGITPDITAEIQRVVDKTYEVTYRGMVSAVDKAKDLPSLEEELKSVRATTPSVVKKAVENPISKLTLSDTLENKRHEITYNIRKQVSIGLVNGDRYETMAKRIADTLDGDYKKAIRIARTEAHKVREQGLNDAAVDCSDAISKGKSGLVMVKTWRTGKDARVRDTHAAMEGVTVLADEEFGLPSGATTLTPGDSGVASEDINCRCYCSYDLMTVEEYEKKTGKKYEKAKVDDLSFDERKIGDITKEQYKQLTGSTYYDDLESLQDLYETDEDVLAQRTFKELKADLKQAADFGYGTYDEGEFDRRLSSFFGSKNESEERYVHQKYALGKQSGDRQSVETYQKWKKNIEENTGRSIADERVKKMLDSVQDYTGENYLDIIAAQQDFGGSSANYARTMNSVTKKAATEKSKAIDELFEVAPKYEGTVYRGLGFDVGGNYDIGDFDRFMAKMKEGEVISMDTCSSWTGKESIAKQFASMKSGIDEEATTTAEVVMVCANPKSGVKIADLARDDVQYQDEVLMPKKAQYRITRIEKKSEIDDDDVENITMKVFVEEVF